MLFKLETFLHLLRNKIIQLGQIRIRAKDDEA